MNFYNIFTINYLEKMVEQGNALKKIIYYLYSSISIPKCEMII